MHAVPQNPIRIIDWKTLREIVPYSRQHLWRLEKAGKFPSRLRLNPGVGDRGRVGWIASEIEEFLQARAALRETDRG
jgi:prophage regulatory protein